MPPVQLIHPRLFGDSRGWFIEVYSEPAFVALGIACRFVQDNHSLSVPAENGHQLFIPICFAHAFVTLEPDCEVTYKCSDTYAPETDGGIRWDSAGIDWPIPASTLPELSAKDAALPALADFDSPFPYDGNPLAPLA